MKTTVFICASTMMTAAGLTACCALSGCARDYSKEIIAPPNQMPSDQQFHYNLKDTSNQPLSYQWYTTNGNPPTATFSVTAVGGTNGPLHYDWSFTNGDAAAQQLNVGDIGITNGSLIVGPSNIYSGEWGQSFSVTAAGGSNTPLHYQWYKNTNNP